MSRRGDLLAGLCAALLLHAAAAGLAGSLFVQQALFPAFQRGESGLALTLLPSMPAEEPVVPAESEQVAVLTEPASEPDIRTAPDLPEAPPAEEPVPDLLTEESPVPPEPSAEPLVDTEPPPAAPTARDADMLEKGVDEEPQLASSVRPVYPLGARLRGEEGVVRVAVTVAPSGTVEFAAVIESSGYAALDSAAVKAVRKARFTPRRGAGDSRSAEVRLTVRFTLVD